MPPRIPVRALTTSLSQPISTSSSTSISSFLVPFLHINSQTRNASILSDLSDVPGAYNKRIRRGRGPSSGKGKTSGRGHKGQKQRGKVPKGFAGGQTSEAISHGKFGFNNVHSIEMSPVNLSRIADWITQGRIDPSQPITLKELTATRAIHGIKDGVKLLADGASKLTVPIHVIVSRASQSAIAAVEALGGTVTTRFYTPAAIKRIRMSEMHPFISLRWDPKALNLPFSQASSLPLTSTSESTSTSSTPTTQDSTTTEILGLTPESRVTGLGYPYRLPDPSGRKELEYYRDVKNRGYLAHTVQDGESASLFFRPKPSEEEIRRLRKEKGRSGRGGSAAGGGGGDGSDGAQKRRDKLW